MKIKGKLVQEAAKVALISEGRISETLAPLFRWRRDGGRDEVAHVVFM